MNDSGLDLRALVIRSAAMEDRDSLLAITNQEDVRRSSFRSEPISSEEHYSWFERTINDSSTLFFVAAVGTRLAGQMRIRKTGTDSDISISVDLAFRRMGIGRKLVEEGRLILLNDHPEVRLLSARIRMDNPPSIQFFERIGFEISGNAVIAGVEAAIYSRRIARSSASGS